MIRIGIIGCGGIANNKHMPALAKVEAVEMVAFCDIIEERASKAREAFGTDAANVYIQDLPEFVALNKKYTGYVFYPLYAQDIAKIRLADDTTSK